MRCAPPPTRTRRPREAFARDFNASAYADMKELCADPAVEVIYIATPHQFHAPHAIMAAEHGKHVILEKPMALTLEDCDAIIAAVERNKVQLIVGHTHAFDPAVRAMRGMIARGELGRLGMINSFNYTNYLYRPRRPEELDTSKGGGILFNQVPHQIDTVRLLAGGLVKSVRAQANVLDPARPTEAGCIAFLQFEDGAAASLVYGGYDFFDSDEWHFGIGERGAPKQIATRRRAPRAGAGQGGGGAAHQDLGLRRATQRTCRRTSRISGSPSSPARRARCAPRPTASSSMAATACARSRCRAARACPAARRCSTTCARRSAPGKSRCTTAAGARPPSRLRSPSCARRARAARSRWSIRWRCRPDRESGQMPVRNFVITTMIAICIRPCAATA